VTSPALTRLLNGILVAGAALCFMFFVSFFYHYTLTGGRAFPVPAMAIVYYGIPLGTAVLLLAGLRLRPDHRLNLVLALASVSAALYLGEHLLAYGTEMRAQARETITEGGHTEERFERIERMAAREGVDFDTRFWFEVVTDLRDDGVDAVPVVGRSAVLSDERPDGSLASRITIDGVETLPLGSIANAVTVFCNETGEYVIYTSDEHGFRNPEGMWQADPLDVAVIGDSFAQGMCMPPDRSFAALIREQIPSTLNLGMAGSGPLVQIGILEEYLRPLEPRRVLWFYFEGNDHIDLVEESRSALLLRYLEGDFRQGLVDRQEKLDEALRGVVADALARSFEERDAPDDPWWAPGELMRTLTRPARLAHIRRSLGLLDPPSHTLRPEDFPVELFRDVAEHFASTVASWGGEAHFVYLPSRDRYANQAEYPREAVLGAVREAGMPIIDLHEAFVAHGDPLQLFPFRRFGHYTEEGHRLVAETVLRAWSPFDGANPTVRDLH
jgi:hypothetical protein